ncbi:MAG: hypothetical protein QOE63_939 [Acidimicrobiaceae bacterium]
MKLKALLRKLVKYGAVSVVSTTISMSVLGALVFTAAVPAAWANVLATAAGTPPSFELNRRWVWGKSGRRSLLAEIGPFCAMTFAGLALSTLAVSVTATWAASAGLSAGARTVVAEGASIAGFGALWLIQFVVLDRVLFRRDPSSTLAAA